MCSPISSSPFSQPRSRERAPDLDWHRYSLRPKDPKPGIAKQSGGGVCVDTRVGEGTTLTVFFPSAEMLPFVEESDALPAIAGRPTSTAHILVVDDDKDVLKNTLRHLQSLGFSVLGAEAGSEALRQLARNPAIDLIVADFAIEADVALHS
jgi:hypothetical protein